MRAQLVYMCDFPNSKYFLLLLYQRAVTQLGSAVVFAFDDHTCACYFAHVSFVGLVVSATCRLRISCACCLSSPALALDCALGTNACKSSIGTLTEHTTNIRKQRAFHCYNPLKSLMLYVYSWQKRNNPAQSQLLSLPANWLVVHERAFV